MSVIIKYPESDEEFLAYYYLRWKILRKPLGQKNKNVKDDKEKESIHVIVKDINHNSIIAIGRIHSVNNHYSQIRFMAVDNKFQKKGYGTLLLEFLENEAKNISSKKIILHARETALDFYKKNGYLVESKSHILFEKIQHWKMYKNV